MTKTIVQLSCTNSQITLKNRIHIEYFYSVDEFKVKLYSKHSFSEFTSISYYCLITSTSFETSTTYEDSGGSTTPYSVQRLEQSKSCGWCVCGGGGLNQQIGFCRNSFKTFGK